jgi:hypothetical protein
MWAVPENLLKSIAPESTQFWKFSLLETMFAGNFCQVAEVTFAEFPSQFVDIKTSNTLSSAKLLEVWKFKN